MLDMRSVGGSDSVGKLDQGSRVTADGSTDPFSQWVNREGEQTAEPRQAAMPPEGPDRLRAAMASVDLLTELDEIDREELPPLAMPKVLQAGTTGGSLEEILVAELGSALSRGIAIPPAANDRGTVASHPAPAIAPTFFAEPKFLPEKTFRRPSAPAMPDSKGAEAAIDRQLLLNRIVRARDAIIAEEQEAARNAAPVDPAPYGAVRASEAEAPEYDIEIEERTGGITRLFTMRRMALAATALALFAGAAMTVGSGGFALPRASTANFDLTLPGAGTEAEDTEKPVAEASAARAGNAVSPAGNAAKPQAAADDGARAAPMVVGPEEAALRSAKEDAQLAERMGGIEPLALVPQHGASPAEEAIRQRLLAGGGNLSLPHAVAASGMASLASAGTLVVNDAADGKSARADAELATSVSPRAQGTLVAGLVPRDPSAVEAAMAATLGLSDLDASQREELKNLLVAGECPSQVLARMFGRAPVVATRDLVRNLENGC